MKINLKFLALLIILSVSLNAASMSPRLKEMLKDSNQNLITPLWVNWTKRPRGRELTEIENLGGRVRANSSWIDATSFLLPLNQIKKIITLKSVESLDCVRKISAKEGNFPNKGDIKGISDVDYGPSFDQMKTIGAVDAQKEGYFGSGVVIGILDTGFDSTHPAVRHIWQAQNVIATHDFNSGDHLESPWGPIPLPFQGVNAKYIHSFDLAHADTLLVATYSIAPEDSLGGPFLSNPWSLYYVKGIYNGQNVVWNPTPYVIIPSDSFATFPSTTTDGKNLFVVWQAARHSADFEVFFSRIDLESDSILRMENLSSDLSPSLLPQILCDRDTLWVFWWDSEEGLISVTSVNSGNAFGYRRTIREGTGMPLGLKAFNREDSLFVVFAMEGEGRPYGASDSVFALASTNGGVSWEPVLSENGFSPDIYFDGQDIWVVWQKGDEVLLSKGTLADSSWETSSLGTFPFPRNPKFLSSRNDSEKLKVLIPQEDGIILSISIKGGASGEIDTIGGPFSDLVSTSDLFYVWRQRGDSDVTPDNYVPHSGGAGYHGTKMLSVIGGFYPGELVGPAPDAKFVLMKTEKVNTRQGMEFENQVEEDFWAEGLEWAAKEGAKIISSSLGYIDWYRKSDLNGKKSPASRVASLALERNVIVVTAIGNRAVPVQFPDPVSGDTSLDAPSDAYDIIAVGGYELDSLGNWVSLAEWNFGPTADGRIKPELVAPFLAYTATDAPGDGEFPIQFGYYTGTSYSTALTAGVAAEVWEAHPSWNAQKVREALLNTADPVYHPNYPDASLPNDLFGYGLVDAYKAIYYEKPESGPFGEDVILSPYPNPFRPEIDKELKIPISLTHGTPATISIFTLSGERVWRKDLTESERHVGSKVVTWPGENNSGKLVAPGTYIVVLTTTYGTSSVKKIAVLR